MPKKSASQRRKQNKNKKKLQSEQASYKHQLEKPELKSEEPKKASKKNLWNMFF